MDTTTEQPKTDPQASEALFKKGVELAEKGEYEAALDAFKQAAEQDPENADALFSLGYWSELRGLDNAAREAYEQCAGLSPAPANALMNLGVLYEDMGRFEDAERCFERVVRADPTNERAALYLKDARGSLEQNYVEGERRVSPRTSALLATPVSDFELSVRSRNCLAKMNVRNLADLVSLTEEDLLGFKNFGETSLQEIRDMLEAKGLRFGMGAEEERETPKPTADVLLQPSAEQEDILDQPLEDLELSIRSRRALETLDIKTVRDLTRLSPVELLKCKNFGQTSLNEIEEKLAEYNLGLRED